MSDAMARMAHEQRELDLVPAPLRESCWGDGRRLWVRVKRVDQFSHSDLAELGRRGFSLRISPFNDVFDLFGFREVLQNFTSVRLANDRVESYRNLEEIGALSRLEWLRIDCRLGREVDFSRLDELKILSVSGDAVLSSFALPRLTELYFGLPSIPAGLQVTAPLQFLSFAVPDLSGLDFVTQASGVISLAAETERFNLGWLDGFRSLRMLELGPVSRLLVPHAAKVLQLPIGVNLYDIGALDGAENLKLLPDGASLKVEVNHAFPVSLQQYYGRDDWVFDQYSVPPGGTADPGGSSVYPFLIADDGGVAEVWFNDWGLVESGLGDERNNVGSTIENAISKTARQLGFAAVVDSEAEAVRVRFDSVEDATAVAKRLSELFLADEDHSGFIEFGSESAG
ncbi:hypothetical protein [Mesorhizobium japonicum]|uniref:hypothetical protein n=1 Tax=Mesorhizobium japonicum TaxID=2066070 RepID=UPI003B5B3949